MHLNFHKVLCNIVGLCFVPNLNYGLATEDCTSSYVNGVLLTISNARGGTEGLQCLNRTEEERTGNYIATTGGDFLLTCNAPGPTEFLLGGDTMISPLMDVAVTRWYSFPQNQKTYRLRGAIYQNNSGRYGCGMAFNNSFSNSVYLYTSESSSPFILQNGITTDIYLEENTVLLPCVCGNAFVPVHLYKITDQGNLNISSNDSKVGYRYDRTKGFFLNISSSMDQETIQGKYICTTDYKNDYRMYNLFVGQGFRVVPDTNTVFLKSWNILKLKCETSTPKSFLWNNSFLSNQSVTLRSTIVEMPEVKLKYIQEFITHEGALEHVQNISVSCGSTYTWNIYINSIGIPPDDIKLTLSTKDTSIECSTATEKPLLILISCFNTIQCDFRRNCLLKEDRCPSISKLPGRRCGFPNCSSLVEPPDSGIIRCSVDDTIKITQYYTGFDNIRYSVESQVAAPVLLKINTKGRLHFTNAFSLFSCKGIGFVLSQMLTWAFVYRNGSLTFLEENVNFNDTRELGQLELISRTSSIYIQSVDVVQLICMAPLIRSSDQWINVTIDIAVNESTKPRITNQNTEFTFYTGESDKNLICSAEGTPPPQILWERNGKSVSASYLALFNYNGDAILRFPSINISHEGQYICTAKNFRGISKRIFTVTIEDTPYKDDNKRMLLGLGLGSLFVIILLFIGVSWLCNSLRKTKELIRQLTSDEVNEFLLGANAKKYNSSNSAMSNRSDNETKITDFLALPYNKDYEITKESLEIKNQILGSGAYGIVLLGTLNRKGEKVAVAVKTVSPDADVSYFKALLSELKIMSHLGKAPNVVSLLGACTKEIKYRKVYIVLEYCGNGNLNDYLRTNRRNFMKNCTLKNGCVFNVLPVQTKKGYVADNVNAVHHHVNLNATIMTPTNLCKWAMETALGMEYLASKKVVHGDLATRNILLTAHCTAKITDFGLSKQLYENTLYIRKNEIPIPWRWMSIEGLKDMAFSSEGDMWSYGVTLWEIFTLGEIPYPGTEWSHSFLIDLENGHRLSCPKYATQEVYDMMTMAWHNEPSCRPSFGEMIEFFEYIDISDF